MDPEIFTLFGIPYKVAHQRPGDSIVTSFAAFHTGVNSGPSYALAKNEMIHDFFVNYIQHYRNITYPNAPGSYNLKPIEVAARQHALLRTLQNDDEDGKLNHLPIANRNEARDVYMNTLPAPMEDAPLKGTVKRKASEIELSVEGEQGNDEGIKKKSRKRPARELLIGTRIGTRSWTKTRVDGVVEVSGVEQAVKQLDDSAETSIETKEADCE